MPAVGLAGGGVYVFLPHGQPKVNPVNPVNPVSVPPVPPVPPTDATAAAAAAVAKGRAALALPEPDYDEAIRQANAALQLKPDDSGAKDLLSQANTARQNAGL